ncbi:dipeptidase [candidate division KSB1 bacterium]
MKRTYLLALILLIPGFVVACTNFLITKGASTDGSVMITYSADSHVLYGELYFRPSADYAEGAMLDVYEWDTGKYLGKIKQVSHTYSVVGNMNEHQVAIGETTYGGREELHHQSKAIVDYGSLMFIALQRAKTAREAIKVMGDLVAEYGYVSHGESFSISDPNEVWIMEMIGKGEEELGAVWVARRIPDGYICGHANQARITTFPLDDPENCLYSEDVISFARKKGWFDGKDKEFSFSDTYAPVEFGGARFCEVRVWAMFNRVNSKMNKYLDYVKGNIDIGKHGYATNRMPLWIKPDKKVSVHDVMELMRDYLQDTELDMSKDIGAGPFACPYRWRPLTWKVDDVTYVNERATSTQQTGFSFVAQSRSWLPNHIGGIHWFGVDDTYSTVYVPMYCGITKVPESYAVGNGDMLEYSDDAAFWAFNFVSNFCYLKWDVMIKDVQKVQKELEMGFVDMTSAIDKAAEELYKTSPEKARQFVTKYSVDQGNYVVKRWKELGKYLLVKYIDGNVKKEENGQFIKNGYTEAAYPYQNGYPEWWYRQIVKETGEKLKVIVPEEK